MLQQKFVTGLDRRLVHLSGCLATISHDGLDVRAVEEMMRGFHSLAGIGGTYGYGSITDAARRGELVCRAAQELGRAADVETLSGVLRTLSTLASTVATELSRKAC